MKFDTPAGQNPIDQLRVVGRPTPRIDGPLKVTGTARYAYEHHEIVPNPAFGYVVGAAVGVAVEGGGHRCKAERRRAAMAALFITDAALFSVKFAAMNEDLSKRLTRLADQISTIIVGKRPQIEDSLACLLAGGHLLIEDVPGVGKTTLAHALAVSLGLRFSRVQFTADLMPSDLVGVSVYERGKESFVFHPGPVFAHVLLADEINRASPRTQSALLEAMGEGQVTVDGTSHRLPDLFFVIATQNPVEFRGTYPLPEAQMDRFALQFGLGYVDPDEEVAILAAQEQRHPIDDLAACATLDDVRALRRHARDVVRE